MLGNRNEERKQEHDPEEEKNNNNREMGVVDEKVQIKKDNNAEFKRGGCFGPACEAFRKLIRYLAGIIALCNASLDILYAYTTIYVIQSMFFLTCALLLLRLLISTIIGQVYYTKYIRNYKVGLKESGLAGADGEEHAVDEKGKSQSNKQILFTN